MSENKFDVVVIGSGPGGYVAAIRAAQLGLKTAGVEKDATLGGTCLNVGCIPSKALLQASEEYAHAGKALKRHGVMVEGLSLDLAAMMGHKDKVVGDLTKGIAHLFKKNDIARFEGLGALGAPGEVVVSAGDGSETVLGAGATIIASGSATASLPGIEIDEKRILSSTGALALGEVPGHLAVVGAGYIGLEMASVWGRLGAKITVIEFLDRILPGMDGELAAQFQKLLRRQKMKFKLSTKVTGAKSGKNGVTLAMEPVASGEAETLEADAVLVAVGRIPYTEGLGLEQAGVALDKGGRIEVDENFATNIA
ncbi:MAG: NAD(P)/FAD-dependent oxidoreductase, partial [Alphaproteobacteria bacterium]|nr:NAD(P)/FAD-dependent oxidoreductase [Alphaproteobacteria bacterium]